MKISRTAIKTICLMLTFTAVLMLSGCTSYDNFRRTFIDKETEDSNVIYVGVFEPESGQYKNVGKEEIKGIQLAHSMYSNVKGVRVELVRIDTESDTNTAKAAIESLIKLNPVAIIGSAEEANSMIAAEEARKAKIPMITPSASNPLITENNPYAFRACITYDQRGTGLAEYTIKELSAKKVAIITIQNDSMKNEEFYNFLLASFKCMADHLEKGGAAYVFHADTEGLNFRKAFIDAGFHLAGCCIWVKDSLVLGRSDYQWQHEPVLYGFMQNGKHHWYSDRKQTTIWNFDKPKRNANHPTSKPLDLLSYPIGNSTQANGVVIDTFGGSGSTLMACEQMNRICYTMELDEKYASVILRRYVEDTGDADGVYVIRDGQQIPYCELVKEVEKPDE